MRILYDHQTFDLQKFGGISRYFSDLIKRVPNSKVGVVLTSNFFLLKNTNLVVYQLFGNISFKGKNFIERNFNRIYSIYLIRKGKFDVFHPTNYNTYFLPYLKKPLVVTVHDMIHEIYDIKSVSDNTIENKKKLIFAADRIIAVSANTKADILKYYDVDPSKISVVYHGNCFKESTQHIPSQFSNYILYVGERLFYKNYTNFLLASKNLIANNPTLKIVLAGKPLSKDELRQLVEIELDKYVISITPNDELLSSLYNHAQMFVYPSFYEGFGIPILEAFSNRCPVCLSNASCFPEVAGDAAVYFDPNSVEEMVLAMTSILNNEVRQTELRNAGTVRVKLFSWDRCAMETQEVYNSLI